MESPALVPLRKERDASGADADDGSPLPGLVGSSPAMQRLRKMIRRVALSQRPVLVTGPTGAGKEQVVRALHMLGRHPEEPLLDINCGAIPEALMESLLFGHEKGAFTGADRRQEGYFSAVGRGTIFLDEVAELPPLLQAKLLRVLETGTFRPIGSTVECRMVGRVLAATHAELEQRVAQGQFREDLYYRLNVLEVVVPSLDERREDIPALVEHFAQRQGVPVSLTPEAQELLMRMPWPGNVRQLRNLLDRLTVFAEGEEISPALLSQLCGRRTEGSSSLREMARTILRMPLENRLEAIEQALFTEALACSNGNQSEAARLLGVHRKAVKRRSEKTGT